MAVEHEIFVSNIGTVYTGNNPLKARGAYYDYIKGSKSGKGRAGGGDVTWFRNSETIKEFQGSISKQEEID